MNKHQFALKTATRRSLKKLSNAYTKHDTDSANVYATELAEIRKMEKMILHAQLALEQIAIAYEDRNGTW